MQISHNLSPDECAVKKVELALETFAQITVAPRIDDLRLVYERICETWKLSFRSRFPTHEVLKFSRPRTWVDAVKVRWLPKWATRKVAETGGFRRFLPLEPQYELIDVRQVFLFSFPGTDSKFVVTHGGRVVTEPAYPSAEDELLEGILKHYDQVTDAMHLGHATQLLVHKYLDRIQERQSR